MPGNALSSAESDPLLDSLPLGLILLDEANRIIRWNQRMQRWSGLSLEAVEGKALPELYPEATQLGKILDTTRASRQPRILSQIFHHWLIPLRLPAGHISGFTEMQQECQLRPLNEPAGHLVITILDVTAATVGQQRMRQLTASLVTARDQAEFTLRDLQEHEFALDQHAIVAVTDARGRITYVNDKFCQLSQYPKEALIGQTHRIVNSGYHPAEFFQSLWQTISSGRVWQGEICNRAKDGHLYWVETTIVPMGQEKGVPTKYIAIRTDITARREGAAALSAAKEAAELANRAKSDFLATMSHEVRTPMNGVLGFTDLLLETPLSAQQRAYTTTIRSSSEALLTIINDILDFSKVEAGQLSLDLCPTDLAQTIQEVIQLLTPKAREKGLTLRTDYPLAVSRQVVIDPVRVRQILLNLLGNALKFTDHGSITVQVSEKNLGDRRQLAFSIIDTGIGLTPEAQTRLFIKFSQADSSTTRRFGGTGLGLAICRQLVELMGGEIGASSAVGQGSTFWFTLPLVESPVEAISPPLANALAPSPLPSLPSFSSGIHLRVLVAEDNNINQIFIMALLEKFGCEADLASNGLEVLQLYQRRAYDLILMDCHMPEMDGYQTTVTIRQLEKSRPAAHRPIPIIALTASAMQADHERCLSVGMDAFLTKPLRAKDLEQFLARYASMKAGAPTSPRKPTA